jgi:ribonuclease Z
MADAIRLILLGSVASIPNATQDNIFMVLDAGDAAWLIDCAGSPLAKLARAGLDWQKLRGLVVTHAHPDHVYGVPILLMNLWLLGRRQPFTIYGHRRSLTVIQEMMALFEWQDWHNLFEVDLIKIKLLPDTVVIDLDQLRITASPVEHSAPNVGLRLVNKRTGGVVVYSSDTERCEAVVRLARGADILIHEATGQYPGHASGADAAQVALEAGARRLVLVHYPPSADLARATLEEAQAVFGPAVGLGRDFDVFEL